MFGRCCSWIRLRAISWVIGANDLPTLAAGAALPGIGENDLPVSARAVEPRTPAARGAAAVSLMNFRLEKSDMIESPFPRPAQQLVCGGHFVAAVDQGTWMLSPVASMCQRAIMA